MFSQNIYYSSYFSHLLINISCSFIIRNIEPIKFFKMFYYNYDMVCVLYLCFKGIHFQV
jgi:hypothetical protein